MSNDEKKERRVITWKQADMNLCKVAAAFIQSIQKIRTIDPGFWGNPFLEANDNREKGMDDMIDYFEYGFPDTLQNPPVDTTGREFPAGTWTNNEEATIWTSQFYGCPQCFYCLVNITRLTLKKQRLMIYRNLFGKGEAMKKSTQSSRNPYKRGASKHGFKND